MRLARSAQSFLLLVVAALIWVASPASAGAQATISGRVTAAESKQPLAEVRVLVIGTNASGITAADGRFRIGNVRAGTVDVQVLRVGYQSQKKTLTLTADETATADFELSVAVVKLSEMVTTATGQQRKIELGDALATISA